MSRHQSIYFWPFHHHDHACCVVDCDLCIIQFSATPSILYKETKYTLKLIFAHLRDGSFLHYCNKVAFVPVWIHSSFTFTAGLLIPRKELLMIVYWLFQDGISFSEIRPESGRRIHAPHGVIITQSYSKVGWTLLQTIFIDVWYSR